MIPTYEERVADDVNFTKEGRQYATRSAAESVRVTLASWMAAQGRSG
jgi:hypothetical protein